MMLARMSLLTGAILSSLLLSRYLGVEAALITTNIDTEEPSVIRSPDRNSGDGFGWAALFHQLQTVSDTDTMAVSLDRTRVVIGAPKGSYPGGLALTDPELPAANRTGLVYVCPLGPGECEGVRGDVSLYIDDGTNSINSDVTNHIQQIFDTDNPDFFTNGISEGRLFDQAPATQIFVGSRNSLNLFDRKDGQLMGSFLASRGDRFMACASRWAFSDFDSAPASQPRGICFVGNRDLESFRTLYPCRGAGTAGSSERNAYCSAGFSGALLSGRVYLGAPGDEEFSGATYSRANDQSNSVVFESLNVGTTQSYFFGFQVVGGHVRENDQSMPESDIAISAPRYNASTAYLGRVYIYSADASPGSLLPGVIEGRQASEFFGYSIALVDLTGDGYDELVVGAPMYTALTPLEPEKGRVYVFFNIGGNLDVANPVIFQGRAAYGRFGFSVANAGDLNGDGHEDLVISAPYESVTLEGVSTQNTGAVYIYYGFNFDSRAAFETQEAQRILANDIVDSVNTIDTLNTFGFTVSGGIDVDNNRHDDIVVGSPDSQAVVVLRSLPFMNVTVTLTSSVEKVNLDVDPSFDIVVSAMYESLNIEGGLRVQFTLREMFDNVTGPRLSFSPTDETDDAHSGEFNFVEAGRSVSATVTVYAMTIVSQLDDYQLVVELLDIPRERPSVSGQQEVTSLNMNPRLRLLGNATIAVSVLDPCGDDGCMTDVVLQPITPSPVVVIAGAASAVNVNFSFVNNGSEDARTVFLLVSDIPTKFFSAASIAVNGSVSASCNPAEFSDFDTSASANCTIISRLRDGESGMGVLTFALRSDFIGNEDDFSVNLEIIVDGSRDLNTDNNVQLIEFDVQSQSGINLVLEFDNVVEYSLETVTNPRDIASLGRLVSLTAIVDNEGPSIIQEARLDINFPSRLVRITDSNYFLYPSSLGPLDDMPGTSVNCTQMGLNPDSLNANTASGKRRRSLPMSAAARRANREAKTMAAKAGIRRKRQSTDLDLDCSDPAAPCIRFSCDIKRLTRQGVRIVLDSHLDGRFFGSAASNRTFALTATANVSVTGFQQDDDTNLADNSREVTINLVPAMPLEEEGGSIIHAIIWPVIGGVIIFIGLLVLLYCVGFFRRKKKPGDGEVEGDFDAPPEVEKPVKVQPVAEKPGVEEATTV